MPTGFVFISTAPAKEQQVFAALSEIEEIQEVHILFGEYDLIVKIQAKDLKELGQLVVKHIRPLDGVADTKTLPGIEL
jgi:DNA-binding Lrp family transcriptional regulator